MNKLLLSVLLLALPVHAYTLTARDSTGNYIVITDKACKLEWLKDWKEASFFYQGKSYEACWEIKGDKVVILDSGGDLTVVPVQMFAKENKT